MTGSSVSHDTFAIERTFAASVAEVYRAFSDPARKARWFAGSEEALGAGYELDFRVGGLEVNRGGPSGGPVYSYESMFRDIVPEERIVYTYEMFADEARISVSVATVELRAEGTGTHLTLTEQGVFLDGLDTSAQREAGTRAMLEGLGTSLGTSSS